MSKRVRKMLLVMLALAMLPAIRLVHRKLSAEREQYGLTHTDVLENAPPALAFTTVAFGGFRGLIANVLWYRANDLQNDGNYFEAMSLSDWITKLQSDIGEAWANRAWNMTYNISVQFPDFHDRWLWINSGLELLRDEGLRYNPNDVELYRELAWIYQDKIGSITDYGNNYFKAALATEMMDALGASLKLDTLLDPKPTKTDGILRCCASVSNSTQPGCVMWTNITARSTGGCRKRTRSIGRIWVWKNARTPTIASNSGASSGSPCKRPCRRGVSSSTPLTDAWNSGRTST